MRFLRHSLTGLFLFSLTLGVLVYAGYVVEQAVEKRLSREARAPQNRERIFAVNVVTAQLRDVAPVLSAFGEVESRRTLDIRAAVGGTVVWLADAFVEGGHVRAGEVLVRIDPSDAQATRDRAASDLQDAEAEKRDAARALALARDELVAAEEQAALRERAFQRQTDLKGRGVGTDTAVETAELAASTARAVVLSRRQAIAQAEARVDQAETRIARAGIALADAERTLAETEIRAGFDGTLTSVTLVEGGLVSQNERIAQLVDNAALEVAFRLPTRGYLRLLDEDGKLRPAPVRVTLDVFGVDLTANGTLSRDSAAVGEGQTGRLVFARLQSSRGLKPGDFVSVEIDEAPLSDVVVLPAGALGADGAVLALGEGDRLETIAVKLLRRQGDDVIVKARDLATREVVAERSPLLGAGIRVRPIRAAGADAGSLPQDPELLELSDERRARLVAFVEGNKRMPEEIRTRLLTQLSKPRVPAAMVQRIESRMGG